MDGRAIVENRSSEPTHSPKASITLHSQLAAATSSKFEILAQQVEINDQIVTDRVINELMGKDASARFRFIMERAEDAQELDV